MIGQQSPPKVPVGAGRRDQRWRVAVLCLVLAAITFAVFGQTAGFGFVNYDDNVYVYENANVAGGLSLKGLAWVFTHADCNFYHPLTMLSLMGDYQLHGLHAGGYHFTNVLLHTASAILLFLILRQMTGALWRSAFVAAVFAIHPLRVESVAWVAERKDVLGCFFFMLTLGAYARYVRKPNSRARYLVVAAAFVLALLSKPTMVTLPFVLLLLDYWPLNRFEQSRKLSGLILEKIPLLALAAGACVMTVLAEGKAIATLATVSMPLRFGNAVVSYAVYLRQMVWPEGLAVPYPPYNSLPPWEVALAGALLAVLSAVAWGERRRRPWMLIGWLWYLGMLTPMIGIVQVGAFPHADRYTYLPQIGIYVAVTWLAAEWRLSRVALGGLMAGVLAVLMFCAWKQTAYWKSDETLWPQMLACTTGNYMAHFNLGNALRQEGRVDDAITHYEEALQIAPRDAETHNNLGIALSQKGREDDAITCFQKALEIQPDYAEAHHNLGKALFETGKIDDAITHFQQASQIKPDYADAFLMLGNAFLQKGSVDNAITQYQQALEIQPAFALAHDNLAIALRRKGRVDEAIAHFQQALQINPDDADAHNNLGNAQLQKGRVDEAIACYQKALQFKPGSATMHFNLGNAFMQKGNADEAIAHFQQGLEIQPADPSAQNNLAWLLATCPKASLRNGARAMELARQANALAGGKNPDFLRTLAAAFAEAGRFGDAVQSAQKAIELARAAGQQELAGQLNIELKRYQTGLPSHP
jgi:tetratricopeptide (TPR) repeat protein